MIIRLDRLGYETEKPANKYIFFEHFLDLMRLIYAVFILLLVLMTSAQCQQTAEGRPKTAPCAGEGATDLSIASPTDQYRAGENLDAGSYTIWYGKRTEGEIGQSDSWSSVPVTLLGGKCYLFDVSTGTCGEVNPIFLNPMMQNPAPHQSVVWYKASTYYAYVVCIEGPLNQASPSVTHSNQYTVAALATESDWNVAPIDTNGNVGGWVAVPWTIYPDGTMEAKGQWKAKWTATGSNKIHCEMTWMASGLTDTWDMVFDTPNTFYGYDQVDNGVNQNGAKFRYGERIQSAATSTSMAKDKKTKVTESMLTASGSYDGYTPITSFDYDLSQNSGWTAPGGQKTGWIVVDFGTVKKLTGVRVIPDRYIATDPSYSYLDRFRIDAWKDGSWQSMSPLISTPEEIWYEVPLKVSTDKIRIWAESDGNGPQIKGIDIYEANSR